MTSSPHASTKVVVIGAGKPRNSSRLRLGLSGLAACKNFLALGFEVEVYESSGHVGGLWRWDPDPSRTTVLKSEN